MAVSAFLVLTQAKAWIKIGNKQRQIKWLYINVHKIFKKGNGMRKQKKLHRFMGRHVSAGSSQTSTRPSRPRTLSSEYFQNALKSSCCFHSFLENIKCFIASMYQAGFKEVECYLQKAVDKGFTTVNLRTMIHLKNMNTSLRTLMQVPMNLPYLIVTGQKLTKHDINIKQNLGRENKMIVMSTHIQSMVLKQHK